MASQWIITPSADDLRNQAAWEKLPEKGRAVLRHFLLVEKDAETVIKNGPVLSAQDRIPGQKYTQSKKIKKITKQTIQIEKAISHSVTEQMSKEVVSKFSGSLSIPDLKAALSAEVQKKVSSSLITSVQESMKTMESYSWEIEEEESNSTEFTVPKGEDASASVTYTTFYKLREHVWRVYLIRSDYLCLTYEGHWLPWFDTRKFKENFDKDLQQPLFKIKFYEPMSELSSTIKPYHPEIHDAKEISVIGFVGPVPNRRPDTVESLTALAEEAFPVTGKERDKVRKAKAKKKKGVAIKTTPGAVGRYSGLKKATKKAAKKSIPRRTSPKKAAPKRAAHKRAIKKSTARRK